MLSYMNFCLKVPLNTTAEQTARLQDLQTAFAEVCNALAPVVQQTRCWNRVTLHHLTYKGLRERFPKIGSQMVCNAIYSVSRTSRLVFQLPNSPFNIAKNPAKGLPLLKFLPNSPVYFDRHTLSLKDGQLSMYTLDGRMRFDLDLKPEDRTRFHQEKLREIVLSNTGQGYQLSFWFSSQDELTETPGISAESVAELPEYVIVLLGNDQLPVPIEELKIA
ncbi:MAG: hypothetical protein NT159_17485 [Proteobacteria bacterium]|nr:hypothetical protein [Pseudomonadota bacterium]